MNYHWHQMITSVFGIPKSERQKAFEHYFADGTFNTLLSQFVNCTFLKSHATEEIWPACTFIDEQVAADVWQCEMNWTMNLLQQILLLLPLVGQT